MFCAGVVPTVAEDVILRGGDGGLIRWWTMQEQSGMCEGLWEVEGLQVAESWRQKLE